MSDVNKKELEFVELYPKIVVYKNMFKDVSKMYETLKESTSNNEDRLFSKWSPWSRFGEYLNPPLEDHSVKNANTIEVKTEIEQNQKEFIVDLLENFHLVTMDYAKRHGVDIDSEQMTKDDQGNDVPLWQWVGPSIAKYKLVTEDPIAMSYHSDYIREPINSPGYKFAITALAYFNDDYEGGEIDFVIDNELYKYKPEAGDYLVFPSGHPEILTKDGIVYLHGVLPAVGTHKYLSRMYWMKYNPGDSEWFEKEKEFGKTEWAAMQEQIMEDFRQEHPNRNEIVGGVRIK
jgi:hypothetical protein